MVQVLHLAPVDVGGVHLGVGVERAVDGPSLSTCLSFVRTRCCHDVVLEPEHLPRLTRRVEPPAVLQIVGDRENQFWCRPTAPVLGCGRAVFDEPGSLSEATRPGRTIGDGSYSHLLRASGDRRNVPGDRENVPGVYGRVSEGWVWR